MQEKLYPFFIILLLSSCSYYTLYTGTENRKPLTDIPLRPHQNNVDVYFNNETPTQPYYRVVMVDATAPANASYNELLNNLKQHASAAGLDGVIILSKQQATNYSNVTDEIRLKDTTIQQERQVANAYELLSAIGLKYYNNIHYMDTIVKTTIIDLFENGKARKLTINFDYYGNVVDGPDKYGLEFYKSNIIPFDIERHTKGSMANWEYQRDEIDNVVSFRLKQGEIIYTAATILPGNEIQYKFYNPQNATSQHFQLQCLYNVEGILMEKKLYKNNTQLWKEVISYKDNTIAGFRRFALVNGIEVLLLQADNYFYNKDDLPTPLNAISQLHTEK